MHPLARGGLVMLASGALLVALAAGAGAALGMAFLVALAILGAWALLSPEKEPKETPTWRCASCGELTNFTRQCGACGAWNVPRLSTEHLVLREWRDSDFEPFADLNADPRVMEFMPEPLDREESHKLARRIRDGFGKLGFGLWAVEVPGIAPFIGFIGLSVLRSGPQFTPEVELRCRLAFDHWGLGYATEGAMAALEFGFRQARLKEIVACTVPSNMRAIRVMEKLGMTRDAADDFDHPDFPHGHRRRRHVLYRISSGGSR